METIIIILISVIAVCYSVGFVLSAKYCNVGFLGYPDTWKNTLAEKVYGVLVSISFITMVITLIILLTNI